MINQILNAAAMCLKNSIPVDTCVIHGYGTAAANFCKCRVHRLQAIGKTKQQAQIYRE
jgi:hypothetical protein